jgi:hypothetical protein
MITQGKSISRETVFQSTRKKQPTHTTNSVGTPGSKQDITLLLTVKMETSLINLMGNNNISNNNYYYYILFFI